MSLYLRQVIEKLVDADVELGARTTFVAQDESGLVYSVQGVTVQDDEAGTTVFLKIEEI